MPKCKGTDMGDRANIVVRQDDNDQIWLYTHWGGTELPGRVQVGLLAARPRWGDASYATKILFGHVVPGDNWHEETGHGISGRLHDNEHLIVVVDFSQEKVWFMDKGQLENFRIPRNMAPPNNAWTFDEFVTLQPKELDKAYNK